MRTNDVLQSTFGGYGLINQENVFKVCDQPHPLLVKTIVGDCLLLKIDEAYNGMRVPPSPQSLLLTPIKSIRSMSCSDRLPRIAGRCLRACKLASQKFHLQSARRWIFFGVGTIPSCSF